mmetsp:Transcript_149411/g.416433  ORF Transcript_149411/g.416433 Transcript_149411/m.416433 type:complete len:92 (-) Transcript_149411:170-445(-)
MQARLAVAQRASRLVRCAGAHHGLVPMADGRRKDESQESQRRLTARCIHWVASAPTQAVCPTVDPCCYVRCRGSLERQHGAAQEERDGGRK